MGVTETRKRELEERLERIAEEIELICEELKDSIWVCGTYYNFRKGAGVRVNRFFEGYTNPGLVYRNRGNLNGILSVAPQGEKKEDKKDE